MQGEWDRISEEPSLQNYRIGELGSQQHKLDAEVAVVQRKERVHERGASTIRDVEGLTHGGSASKGRQAGDQHAVSASRE